MTFYLYLLAFFGIIRTAVLLYTVGKFSDTITKKDKWPEMIGVFCFNAILFIPSIYFLILGF